MPTGGERDASFERAYRDHARAILRFTVRRVGGGTAAQDVASEAFLAAWRQWDRLPAVPEEVLPWLYRFAGNAVRNQRRSDRRQVRLTVRLAESDVGAEVGADPSISVSGVAALIDAFAKLSESDQEVLRLLAWERVADARELGLALGISPAAARVRTHRARRRLQACLAAAGDDESSPGPVDSGCVAGRPPTDPATSLNVEA